MDGRDQGEMPVETRWSAGGVVLRPGRDHRHDVVLVGRTAESLWTLPKGTPDRDESVEQTAVREVTEETGIRVRPGPRVDETHYTFVDNPRAGRHSLHSSASGPVLVDKTVYWYLMEPVGGDVSQHDDEFDRVEWVSAEEALELLTYDNEARVLEKAVALYAGRSSQQGTRTDSPGG